MTTELIIGDDGLARPAWAATDPLLREYYDTEWGMPVRDEHGLFERLSLEAFQSGLSWAIVLRKRPGFRAAFAGFDPDAVAAFDEADVERLLLDAAIIRNRAKILATIGNARATVALREDGGLRRARLGIPAGRAAQARADGRHPVVLARVRRSGEGAETPWIPLRRTHHGVRPDGGDRDRRHAPGGKPPARVERGVARGRVGRPRAASPHLPVTASGASPSRRRSR